MNVNIIVAVGNYVTGKGYPIGKDGKIPWHNSADLKWFKEMTLGHSVIMGRKTYEAIGKPLVDRINIVVSSHSVDSRTEPITYSAPSIESAISQAKALSNEDIFIIGGASIYKYALEHDLVDNIYIDYLSENVTGADVFFDSPRNGFGWFQIDPPMEIEKSKAYAVHYAKVRGLNNNVDNQYLNLVNDIIEHGEEKDTRAGKTRSMFGKQLRFNLKDGLPVLTTKKMFTKGVIHELLWFIKGDTNIKYLVDNGVHIWDDDAYRYYMEWCETNRGPLSEGEIYPTKEEFLEMVKNEEKIYIDLDLPYGTTEVYKYGDLGPVYGKQWTSWGGHNQIYEVIETLKKNPDDRRMIICAWNVDEIPDMALPPCHYCCQFYTTKMTEKERFEWAYNHFNHEDEEFMFNYYTSNDSRYIPNSLVPYLDRKNVPIRKLSCMWHQRSVDCGLGLSFNILSYSLLTHMIAHCCNMDVDELIFDGGDVHIYENHIEPLKEQLKRNPHMYALPKLVLNPDVKNIFDFKYEDIKIEDYQSYPTIKMPLSVGLDKIN